MSARAYLRWATLLATAGAAFSGYLGGVRFFSGTCAFNDPCPFFLGYPACYTGFVLFSALLVTSLAGLVGHVESTWPMIANLVIASLGSLFAGRLALIEFVERGGGRSYGMGLPTCAYGLLFFAAMLVLSLVALRSHGVHSGRPAAPPRPQLST